MIYRSYTELIKHKLKYNDEIIFVIKNFKYYYKVEISYLYFLHSTDPKFKKGFIENDTIFKILNIADKYKFCSQHYGYKTMRGDFPITKLYDYEKLTNITLELFKLCDNYVDANDIWN